MAIDFGAILDKSLEAYQTVSVVRAQRDTARYNNAGATQAQALHASEANTPIEAYQTGNVKSAASSGGASYFDKIPKPLLYGSLGLLGLALVLRSR